ncbi:MAG: Gfo/Idh/MocA family oxidoreductase [FCB group bacterium]|nr:Gfo/Idh/MocA family oxidoreductase [FCB group bacterium]
MNSRRDFLKGTAWMLGAAAVAGCATSKGSGRGAGVLSNFAVPPMERIRVGFIGIGERGTWAVHRITSIPGIETAALCDLRPQQVDAAKKWLGENRKPGAMRECKGTAEIWKDVCEDPGVDVVYICTPAELHCEEAVYALECGKHVLVEVPGAQTVDECWAIVEAAEKARRHCMMLENCVYGENELLAWNLCHQGILGTLTHAEGGYIHNLVWRHLEDHFRTRAIQKPGTVIHRFGNTYPTHALGPICTYMDMNRGDRMERIVSMSSLSAAHSEFAAATYKPEAWQNKIRWLTGDINTSIINTAKGRTIMMQADMSTPRPYSRINLVQGTKGCFGDFPLRLALSPKPGGDAHDHKSGSFHRWLDEKALADAKAKYMHPLYKAAGEVAKKVGGHGGMDFMMDLCWAYRLQNGLPLDMDVYDLASWSSICPCSAESDRRGGEPVELPDFTRGGWKSAKPVTISAVDLDKMGYDRGKAKKTESQMNV